MKQLGSYKIVRTLRTNPRDIYLAEHPVHNQVQITVAAKVTPIAFLQEANHPVILPILDVFEANNNTYIVEPYLSGGSLEQRLEKACLFPHKAAYILERLSDALEYALNNRVMYNHLHPRDILFGPSGEIFLPGSECQESDDFNYHQYRRIHIRTMGRLLFAMLTQYFPPDREETYKDVPQLDTYRTDLHHNYQTIIEQCLYLNTRDPYYSTREIVQGMWFTINEPEEYETIYLEPRIIISKGNLAPEIGNFTLPLSQRVLIVIGLIVMFFGIVAVLIWMGS